MLFTAVGAADAAVLAGWDVSALSSYGPTPFSASVTAANITVGGLTRGAGVTTSGTAASRAWGGTGWNYTTAANAISANAFATCTIKANSGYKVSFSSISRFDYRRSSTGAASGLLQYSIGAGFVDIGPVSYSSTSSSGASLGATDLSGISDLQNVPDTVTVTFRIVNYGASASTGPWYIFDVANTTANDFEISGTVAAVSANSSQSDIVRASGFTEPISIDYASYQATDITAANSVEMARFTIRDGGASADADSLGTTLSAISFTVANGAALRRVALYDGSTEIGEVDGGATVSFSGLSGLVAADGGTKDFSIRATFNASVTDNQQVQFTVNSATADPAGSTFAAANAGGAASDITGNANKIAVTATKLAFVTIPSLVVVGQNFTAVVQARDANNNVDLDNTASITISKASGSGSLSGGAAKNLSSGAQTWSSLQIDTKGAFTIQASGGGLTAATSGSLTAVNVPLAISGFMPNPPSTDAPYEYVQLIALEDIDFAVTPMSVVWNNNGTATANGWVAGGALTYKFNITSGTMSAGDIGYVGGSGKLINGSGSTDISGQKWLRAIDTANVDGDDFGTHASSGSLGNGGTSADGIALFMGTSLTDITVPLDAVFFGSIMGSAVVSAGTDGYVLPVNDLYNGGYLQTSSALVIGDPSASLGQFVKLTGTYNAPTRSWTVPRTASFVTTPVSIGDIATGITLANPAAEPTTQATGVNFSNVQPDRMDVSWTSGNGANRLVICRQANAPSSGPLDSTTYTANADFSGGGSALGGGKVVYSGSGSSFTLTGLSASTTYYLEVYEYNGTGININYLTSTASGNPNSQLTAPPPHSSASDIVRASGFTEPANIDYASYQATDITDANSIELARFTIRDGGVSTDSDSDATTLTDISFTVANGGNLRRVALYDGTTEIAEVAGGSTVAFSGLTGLAAPDGGTKNFSVRATFNASVTDNQQLRFTVNSASADSGGSGFAAADAGAAASDITGDANRIEVTASKLVFSSVPSTVIIGQNFSATVYARDANNNVDLDSTASVTLIKATGSGTLTGGGAQNLASGAQTWSSLQMDTAGSFTIQASGGGLTAAASGSISAAPGPTTLAAGDVVIIGYNSAGTPSDNFAILVTRTLGAGSVFFVCDDEVTSVGGSSFADHSEAQASFTVKAGQYIPAGTVIILPWGAAAVSATSYDWSSTLGAGINNNADELYVYTAPTMASLTPSAFICGITIGTGSGGKRPTGLVDGLTWLAAPPSGSLNASRYKTSGATYTATTNAIMSAIGNVAANWETASAYTMADTDWTFTFVTPAPEPTVQANSVSFANVNATQMDVSWTSGDGESRIVVCRQGSAPSSGPLDGTAYTANSAFSGSGSALGGGKVVYNGADDGFTLTGLDPNTTYYLRVYEYNGLTVTINYLTSAATDNPNSQVTQTSGASAASDIARASTFTEPVDIDYSAYQATDITAANSIELARFTIRDGGGSSDADALATTLDAITFNVAQGALLRRVALYDGSTEIAEIAGGATATFTGLSGLTAADGGTKEFSIRATFASSVTDNQQIQFTITSATANSGGSGFAAANAGGASSDITGNANRIEVTATKLVFSAIPSSVTVGQSFSVTVQARDANNNIDLDSTESVTITKASGSGTLAGGGAQNLVSGSRGWSSLQIDTAGTFTLQAAGGGLTAATSGSIQAALMTLAISGYMANPAGTDAPYEYVQLIALANINFASTPMSVVWLNNGTATIDGWAAGGSVTYKFNITSGSMNAGDVAYVGGNGKLINGSGTADISGQTWLRAINTGTTGGDDLGTANGTGSLGNGGTADGIAIFTGTAIDGTTVPMDAVFFGTSQPVVSGGTDGYVLPVTELYSGGYLQSSSLLIAGDPASGGYVKLSGVYNTQIKSWTTPRTASAVSTPTAIGDIATGISLSSPAVEPTVQASGVNFSSVQATQMNVAWTSGNGANRLVICRQGLAPSAGPFDGTAYTANASFSGSGTALGGGKVVYSGSGSSFTLTGLDPSSTYYLQVFEYNGTGVNVNYLTSTAAGNPNSQATQSSGLSSASDVIRATGFSEPENIAYALYQATDITAANSIELARFTIRDGGGSADADAADTTLTAITFTVANGARLRRVALYDGSTEIAEVAGGATVTFSGLAGLVASDNGTKDFSVRATFQSTVTDNQQIQFAVSSATADIGGSAFASSDASGAASDITGDANRIEVSATKLAFTTVPASVIVGQNFTVIAQAQDANNNVDLDSAASVTLSKASGSGALTGGDAQALAGGAQTWSSVQMDTAGSFTIQASGGGLTSATSASIAATPALSAGDLAIVGRINNTTPDSFALAALADISAGTVVYFTDNGWSNSAPAAFRGSTTSGSGNEQLMKLTVNSTIKAGTVFRTTDTDSRWTWTTSGAIPNGASANYASLSLGTGGDQIYAFQAANLFTNPLGSVSAHIFVLDDTDGFEDPDSTSGAAAMGNVPPGLSAGANTALTFPFGNNNIVGLDMAKAGAVAYSTKAEWLAFIGDVNNWTTSASQLPSGGLPFGTLCIPATPPRMVKPADPTFTVGGSSSISVTANDPGCYGVTLSAAGLPGGASFQTAPYGTNTIGTITWHPNLGQEGAHPVLITATDSDSLHSSIVVRINVAGVGELLNSQGMPMSLTNWSPRITNILVDSAGNVTVDWETVEGIPYDIYRSVNNFGGAMTWSKVVDGMVARDAHAQAGVSANGSQQFFQAALPGTLPNSNNVWGVIRPTVQASTFTMMSPPLDGDRKFNGAFGANLAQALTAGDQVHIYEPTLSSWRTLTLSGGTWMEGVSPSGYELAAGQGFFVLRTVGSSAQPRFTGPVGNNGCATNTIVAGDWNIVGLSQGRQISISQAFTNLVQGSPQGSWDENAADLVVMQNSDGSWHRIMRAGNGTWFDLSTFGTASVTFTPGQAFYYFRQGGPGSMKVRF